MALEPVAGQVYFSPECHAAYAALGFSPSPGPLRRRRGAPRRSRLLHEPRLGDGAGARRGGRRRVRGVQPRGGGAVRAQFGWSKVDAATICAARTEGAVGAAGAHPRARSPRASREATDLLAEAVAPLRPEGKPLFAGLLSLGLPGRSDGGTCGGWPTCCASTAATRTPRRGRLAGLDATEVGLLTELYWGLPLRSYIRTRAWSDAQLAAAEERLVDRGLLADGAFTAEGRVAPRVRRGRDRCPVHRHARRARGRVRQIGRPPHAMGPGHPRRRGLPAAGPARPGAGRSLTGRHAGAAAA